MHAAWSRIIFSICSLKGRLRAVEAITADRQEVTGFRELKAAVTVQKYVCTIWHVICAAEAAEGFSAVRSYLKVILE